jgi:hypothetical protein
MNKIRSPDSVKVLHSGDHIKIIELNEFGNHCHFRFSIEDF